MDLACNIAAAVAQLIGRCVCVCVCGGGGGGWVGVILISFCSNRVKTAIKNLKNN